MKKLLVILAIFLLGSFTVAEKPIEKPIENKLEREITFSYPELIDCGNYVKVHVKEANSLLATPEKPLLPIYSLTFEFPLGTKIISVDCDKFSVEKIDLEKEILPAPKPKWIGGKLFYEIHNDGISYPDKWFSYKIGGGLSNGKHVTFLSIHFYPVRYLKEKTLEFVKQVKIRIIYKPPLQQFLSKDKYDLLIVAPSSFAFPLQKLAEHKERHGIATKLIKLEEIYSSQGKDKAEKIKYFIKNAVEEWGIKYVLLVGSVDKLPMRKTWFWDEYFVTDLYYADLYDANGSFSSWDTNNNGYYGEYLHDGKTDFVDLYPDVYVGRLACSNIREVKTVVNKIINYETLPEKEWFNRIILCGGDTFPGNDLMEGEYMNQLVAENMSEFKIVKLWASSGNLNAKNIFNEINKGAGFIHFSGHGSLIGWATHPYNSDEWIGFNILHTLLLFNGYKLPIIFLDACSTAHLDIYLINIKGIITKTIPCFAWTFIKNPRGGAIATIGSTRVAYTLLTEGGAGYLGLHFFLAYKNNATPAEMLVQAQNDYLNNLWKDGFTIEEFILLGDPSLRIGGYYE